MAQAFIIENTIKEMKKAMGRYDSGKHCDQSRIACD